MISGAGSSVTNAGTFAVAPSRILSVSDSFTNFGINTLTCGTYNAAGNRYVSWLQDANQL